MPQCCHVVAHTALRAASYSTFDPESILRHQKGCSTAQAEGTGAVNAVASGTPPRISRPRTSGGSSKRSGRRRSGARSPADSEPRTRSRSRSRASVVADEASSSGGGGASPGGGPLSLTCSICGRGFGSSSLGIHMKQCAVKRAQAQQQLDAAKRTAAAPPPDMAIPSRDDFATKAEFLGYGGGGVCVFVCTHTLVHTVPDPIPLVHAVRWKRTTLKRWPCLKKASRSVCAVARSTPRSWLRTCVVAQQ